MIARRARRAAAAAAVTAGLLAVGAPAAAQTSSDELPDAGEARERANEILSGDRFQEGGGSGGVGGGGSGGGGFPDVPEGGGGSDGGGGLDVGLAPSLSWLLYGALLGAIIALAVWLGRRAVNQEVTEAIKRERAASPGRLDPDELERAAAEAESGGEMATALRLRFQACLLRLAEAGAIKLRPSLTARGAGRQLRSPEFDDMVRSFESVAYGGREPSPEESRAARESWPGVVARLAG